MNTATSFIPHVMGHITCAMSDCKRVMRVHQARDEAQRVRHEAHGVRHEPEHDAHHGASMQP
jgi:hypothetical protein